MNERNYSLISWYTVYLAYVLSASLSYGYAFISTTTSCIYSIQIIIGCFNITLKIKQPLLGKNKSINHSFQVLFSVFKGFNVHHNVTAITFCSTFSKKLKTAVVNLGGQRKLPRGNRIKWNIFRELWWSSGNIRGTADYECDLLDIQNRNLQYVAVHCACFDLTDTDVLFGKILVNENLIFFISCF